MEIQNVNVNGTAYGVDIIRTRNRNAYARVLDGRIRISIPGRVGRPEAERIADGLYKRIKRSIERHPEYYTSKQDYLKFSNNQKIVALGREFSISIYDCNEGPGSAIIEDNGIRLFLPKGLDEEERDATASYLVRKALSKSLKSEIRERLDRINNQHFNSGISGIRITNANSRWGSCSRRKGSDSSRISLNFKLLFMPERCLEYVMVHELAHTKELNHSERFWGIVSGIIPDYRERKKLLRENRFEISQ